MIIKTIERSASREYNILGLKEWKGVRMVAEINETEDEYECGKELERKVERQLDNNRELTDAETIKWDIPSTGIMSHVQMPSIDRKAIERVERLIDDCTTPDEVANLWDKAVEYGLKDFYEKKLKQLQ